MAIIHRVLLSACGEVWLCVPGLTFVSHAVLFIVVRRIRSIFTVGKVLSTTDTSWLDVETFILVEAAEIGVVSQNCNILRKMEEKQ